MTYARTRETYARTRLSLRGRIEAAQAKDMYTVHRPFDTGRSAVTFAEIYRGTEFEARTRMMPLTSSEPAISRGRAFLILASAALATVATAAFLVSP